MKPYWLSLMFALIFTTSCSLPGTSPLRLLSHIDSFANDITFSPNGQLLAAGTLQDGVKLWNVRDRILVASLGTGDVRSLAFSPDSRYLVTGDSGEQSVVRIWELAEATLVRTLDPSLTPWVSSVALSPDGSLIAVGTNKHVHLFRFTDGLLLHTFNLGGMQVAFSPDGRQLAVAENVPIVHIWNLADYSEHTHFPGHGFGIAYAPNGSLFATPGWNGQGMISFEGAEQFATTVGGENEVQLWSVVDRRHIRAVNTHGGQIHSLAFSPDSRLLVSGGNDNTVRLSDVTTGDEVGSVTLDKNINTVAFSPDGTLIAIGVYQTIYLWPIEPALQADK